MEERITKDLRVGDYAEKTNIAFYPNAALYAAIVGDSNPIHFETEEAHQSRFGKPIVHGMILAGFISAVIGMDLPGNGCIYKKQSITFLRPAFYGESILTRVTVMEIDSAHNTLVLKTECFNPRSELVCTGEAVVLPKAHL